MTTEDTPVSERKWTKAGGTTSMFWAGRAAYQSGLTADANPWDGNDPAEARKNWSWRKGFASAASDALQRAEGEL